MSIGRFIPLYLLALTVLGAPAISLGDPRGADVTLTEQDGRVILDNGVIQTTINPASARVVSLRFAGHEMVSRDRQVYFSLGGGKQYEQPSRCVYSVTRRDADHIDISCKRTYTPSDHHAWDIDIHYVLRRGDAGLYSYASLEHPADYPDVGFGEWRMVWWMPHDEQSVPLLEKICVDALRNWVMPGPDAKPEVQGIKEIVKLTAGPWAGKYDCKYAYAGEYAKLGAWGHASDRNQLGAWVVLGGDDYLNDGPTKQDLTSAAGIIHLHLYQNHYGARGLHIPSGQAWRKVYGPWLMYVTDEPTADANWAAAKKRAERERSQWPYTWMTDPDYPPAAQRGSVTGRLVVRDPLKPGLSAAKAWVGLAKGESKTGKNWQFQGEDYQYWTRAASDGSFTVPAVRPGTYTLHAFMDGAVGEYARDEIIVRGGEKTALDAVTWNVPRHGTRLAWEIGTPDRTASEFRHGKTDYWEPYLFQKFAAEFANPLVYDVAKNNIATEINYAHSRYERDGSIQPWVWRINFELREAPKGDATLTLAFAGSHAAALDVHVNSDAASPPLATVDPPNQGGNALLREGVHAKYGVSRVTIPANLLRVGRNTISLTQTQTKSAASHVMYDYLSLELP